MFERAAPKLTQVLTIFSVPQFTSLCNTEEVQKTCDQGSGTQPGEAFCRVFDGRAVRGIVTKV